MNAPSLLYSERNLMKSMKSMKRVAQAGFTLIELIVVIVILGILAATALPKFVSFGGDARAATVNAARGAMLATASMVKGKWVVEGGRNPTVTIEDQTVTYVVGNGYPTAAAAFVGAAGLGNTADYVVVAPGSTATANAPATTATQIAVIPASIAGTPAGLTCFARYTAPAASSTAAGTVDSVVTGC